MAVAALPAIISATASVAGGAMAMSQANYQAQVAQNNAKVAKYNAERAMQVGSIDAQMKDLEHAQLIGEQVTQQAASGVTVSGASQIRTRNASRFYAAADRTNIIENATMERYNHLVEATNFKAEAASAKASGRAAMVGGILGAAGDIAGIQGIQKSLVGGASSTAKVPRPTARPWTAPPKPRLRPSIGPNPLTRPRYNTRYPV